MNLKLLAEDNYWLLLVFALYLITILIFSLVYYVIHSRNPESFSFNEDVLRSQRELFKSEAEKGIVLLSTRLAALNDLTNELKGAPLPFPRVGNTNIIEIGDFRFECKTNAVISAIPGGMRVTYALDLYNKSDKIGDWISPMSAFQLPDIIKTTEKKLTKLRKRLATLSTTSPMVWSYWDFLYFSVITQATVGYGDILPNRTAVRMLVCLQTLIALVFLVVVINLVFRNN